MYKKLCRGIEQVREAQSSRKKNRNTELARAVDVMMARTKRI